MLERAILHGKKGKFSKKKMKWKEGSSRDLKPDTEIASLDLEKLDLVKSISLGIVKLVQLKQAGLWSRPVEPPQGEDSGSMSRAGTGINLCVRLK